MLRLTPDTPRRNVAGDTKNSRISRRDSAAPGNSIAVATACRSKRRHHRSAGRRRRQAPTTFHCTPREGPATPWDAAADGGVAIGKASQKAAGATAGFFNALRQKLAASF